MCIIIIYLNMYIINKYISIIYYKLEINKNLQFSMLESNKTVRTDRGDILTPNTVSCMDYIDSQK
jgi:hypothetical protein